MRLTSASVWPSLGRLARAAGTRLLTLRRFALAAAVALALGAAGVGIHYYLTHARHFALTGVRLSPLGHVSAESLRARAAVVPGTNLFSIDRAEVARAVGQEPWVKSVHVRLELPATLAIDVVEHEAAFTVALGPLYLAEPSGALFKRAAPDEAAGLPVVTGIERDDWVAQAEAARSALAQAAAAVAAWGQGGARPPLGEAHVDRLLGVTLYTVDGVGIRLGRVDDSVAARLQRYDAVRAALQQSGEAARLIYLDNRARPDRVTVKLASADSPAPSETN